VQKQRKHAVHVLLRVAENWDMTPFSLAAVRRRFGGMDFDLLAAFSFSLLDSFFDHENGNTLLRNVDELHLNCTVPYLRRSLLWEPGQRIALSLCFAVNAHEAR
jgi:hypothetical protein